VYLYDYHLDDGGNQGKQKIEDEEEEILSVKESYTIVDPGTVMIHIQYALAAFRTVVASFWFEVMTD
jgi:hypothetical protein